MASESETGTGKNAERAGLPFEPKRDKKKAGKESNDSGTNRATAQESDDRKVGSKKSKPDSGSKNGSKKKASKGKTAESASQVSAKAQARADEILAGNRRKSKAKAAQKKENARGGSKSKDSGAIPEVVSRRMMKRMGILSGAPVFLGVGIFFLAYYLQSHELADFPPVAVLLVTMGCFGLGVLGLTYGVLSASWDTEPGSLIGLSEFKLNFGRVMEARKASKT